MVLYTESTGRVFIDEQQLTDKYIIENIALDKKYFRHKRAGNSNASDLDRRKQLLTQPPRNRLQSDPVEVAVFHVEKVLARTHNRPFRISARRNRPFSNKCKTVCALLSIGL